MFRTNKNAILLIAADDAAIRKARATARTRLAALREISQDHHRLGRFNKEQREQLTKRLETTEHRLPQQIVMAYRHLLLLTDQGAGPVLEHIDLGPARVDARIPDRVLDHLRSADRIAETSLAPAALLAARFGLLPAGVDAVELDELLASFGRLPRLPKLASSNVLRNALVDGVRQGLFGLASDMLGCPRRRPAVPRDRRRQRDPLPARDLPRPRLGDRAADCKPSTHATGTSCTEQQWRRRHRLLNHHQSQSPFRAVGQRQFPRRV